jgi:hypothetical protein
MVLQSLYYLLGTKPNPLAGVLDFYFLNPLGKAFRKSFKSRDFVLRDKWVATALLCRAVSVCALYGIQSCLL